MHERLATGKKQTYALKTRLNDLFRAGHGSQGTADRNLRTRRRRNGQIRVQVAASAQNCRLLAGDFNGDSDAVAQFPHRRAEEVQRGLPEESGEERHRRVGTEKFILCDFQKTRKGF